MATIPNYPQDLIDEHMAWHMNPIGTPGARSATNQGLDFLQFHHNFVGKFFAWFNTQPEPFRAQFDVTPWTVIPAELKNDANTGWNSVSAGQETRITTFTPPFANEDAFGTFIERGLHNNYLHGACAVHFNDPNIGSPMTQPVISTYFYKIHGLVDYWWTKWKEHAAHDVFDSRRFTQMVSILFGVVNDGGGAVLGPNGPTPVDPWGPLVSLAPEKRDVLLGVGITELAKMVSNAPLKAQVHNIGVNLMKQSLEGIKKSAPQS